MGAPSLPQVGPAALGPLSAFSPPSPQPNQGVPMPGAPIPGGKF